jgi:predicted DNA-binding transcriptional regulator AlpA
VAILNYRQVATKEGVSVRTVQRRAERGEGPPLIQLSPRRVGIDEADHDAFLASRRKPRPAPDAPTAIEAI